MLTKRLPTLSLFFIGAALVFQMQQNQNSHDDSTHRIKGVNDLHILDKPIITAEKSSAYNLPSNPEQYNSEQYKLPPNHLEETLTALSILEGENMAGWGIEDASANTGWVLLVGDQLEHDGSVKLLSRYENIQIRYGAQHSLAELLVGQQQVLGKNNHQLAQSPKATLAASIKENIASVDINMAANKLVVTLNTPTHSGSKNSKVSENSQGSENPKDSKTATYSINDNSNNSSNEFLKSARHYFSQHLNVTADIRLNKNVATVNSFDDLNRSAGLVSMHSKVAL